MLKGVVSEVENRSGRAFDGVSIRVPTRRDGWQLRADLTQRPIETSVGTFYPRPYPQSQERATDAKMPASPDGHFAFDGADVKWMRNFLRRALDRRRRARAGTGDGRIGNAIRRGAAELASIPVDFALEDAGRKRAADGAELHQARANERLQAAYDRAASSKACQPRGRDGRAADGAAESESPGGRPAWDCNTGVQLGNWLGV